MFVFFGKWFNKFFFGRWALDFSASLLWRVENGSVIIFVPSFVFSSTVAHILSTSNKLVTWNSILVTWFRVLMFGSVSNYRWSLIVNSLSYCKLMVRMGIPYFTPGTCLYMFTLIYLYVYVSISINSIQHCPFWTSELNKNQLTGFACWSWAAFEACWKFRPSTISAFNIVSFAEFELIAPDLFACCSAWYDTVLIGLSITAVESPSFMEWPWLKNWLVDWTSIVGEST